jgi:hypothetical protein
MRCAMGNSTASAPDSPPLAERHRPWRLPPSTITRLPSSVTVLTPRPIISCYDTKWVDGSASSAKPGDTQEVCRAQRAEDTDGGPAPVPDRGSGPRPFRRGRRASPTARSPPVGLPGRGRPGGSAHRARSEHPARGRDRRPEQAATAADPAQCGHLPVRQTLAELAGWRPATVSCMTSRRLLAGTNSGNTAIGLDYHE